MGVTVTQEGEAEARKKAAEQQKLNEAALQKAEKDAEEAMLKVRMVLTRWDRFPFFAPIVMRVKHKPCWSIPTMGVSIKDELIYNPLFVNQLSTKIRQLAGVVMHEYLHLVFLHLHRSGIQSVAKHDEWLSMIWNLAADAFCNMAVLKNNLELPDIVAVIPDVSGDSVSYHRAFDPKYLKDNGLKESDLVIHDLSKKGCEEVYTEMFSKLPRPPGKPGACMAGVEKSQGQGEGDGEGGQGQGNGYEASPGGGDFHDYGNEMSPSDRQEKENEHRKRVMEGIEMSRSQGRIPLGLERLLKELTEPTQDWRTVLTEFITKGIPYDVSYRRPSKRSSSIGTYMPKFMSEGMKVLIAVDTSGSIGDKCLGEFFSEALGICNSFQEVKMWVICWDFEAYPPPKQIDNDHDVELRRVELKGGGGTSCMAAIEWAKANRDEYPFDAMVMFTDGYCAPFPSTVGLEGMNVIWCISPDGIPVSEVPEGIGRVVKIFDRKGQ